MFAPASFGQNAVFPAVTDPNFCQVAQKYISATALESDNTVFVDMPAYRASKPMVEPLQTFQVLQYSGQLPVMVSCKMKGSAHLRSAHGEAAAGEQRRLLQVQFHDDSVTPEGDLSWYPWKHRARLSPTGVRLDSG